MAARTPVDDVITLVNHVFVVKSHKYFAHRLGQTFIHGETLAVPVTGAPQSLELIYNDAAVFFLPFPNPGDKFFPPEVMA